MKARADKVLLESGLLRDIKECQSFIMQGLVYADDKKVEKSGDQIDIQSSLYIKRGKYDFVSRGGVKLEKAIEKFGIELEGKISMDVGCSTGGFTDCMLRHGAKKVYAVDVGYGQLAWQLRNDERVIVMERTNIRNVTREIVTDFLDFISIDVSFISLKLVIPIIKELLAERGYIVALIKPQFEAKRSEVEEGGLIKDEKTHVRVIRQVLEMSNLNGLYVKGLDFSPIKGATGNIEFLAHITREKTYEIDEIYIEKIVKKAHKELN